MSAVIDEAVAWLTHLWSGTADDVSREEWQRWRAAHPEHERAWQQIETIHARFAQRTRGLSAASAVAAVNAPRSASRREALKLASLLLVGSSGGWIGYRELPWREWSTDARTATGERRKLTLVDGTQLMLNTDSAVDLRYDARQRRLRLWRGEILVATSPDIVEPARPFVVETAAGVVRPVGTRFVVHQVEAQSRVAVLDGAVDLHPADVEAPVLRLRANQAASFSCAGIESPVRPIGMQTAWTDGVLVASNTRLGDFIVELQRYHPGRLSCEPSVADLRISGTFPLDDTVRVLQALTEVLPVQTRSWGGWWTRIGPLET